MQVAFRIVLIELACDHNPVAWLQGQFIMLPCNIRVRCNNDGVWQYVLPPPLRLLLRPLLLRLRLLLQVVTSIFVKDASMYNFLVTSFITLSHCIHRAGA